MAAHKLSLAKNRKITGCGKQFITRKSEAIGNIMQHAQGRYWFIIFKLFYYD